MIGFTGPARLRPASLGAARGAELEAWGRRCSSWRRSAGAEGLQLWVFQRNVGARRFYERHGFTLTELTDGSRNEEREPDALCVEAGS